MNNTFKRKWKFFIPFFIVAGLGLGGAAVMLLWNAILPDVLHVSTLNFWQALGLLALSRMLFGGSPFRGRSRHGKFGGPPPYMRRKFMNMTEEERQAYRQRWMGGQEEEDAGGQQAG